MSVTPLHSHEAPLEIVRRIEELRHDTDMVRWILWAIKGRDPVTGATDIREVL